MTKGETKAGYIYLKTTAEECGKWGGLGICDDCNKESDSGYLVPVLNCWLCKDCFSCWEEHAVYHPEDIPYEAQKTAYYESILSQT